MQITEEGRRFVARQLADLSERQVVSLFAAAHFGEFHGAAAPNFEVNAWAQVFRAKVREINAASPCPF